MNLQQHIEKNISDTEVSYYIKERNGNYAHVNQSFLHEYDMGSPREILGQKDTDLWSGKARKICRSIDSDDDITGSVGELVVSNDDYIFRLQSPPYFRARHLLKIQIHHLRIIHSNKTLAILCTY